MDPDSVLLERRAGVAVITLNDPDRRNALTLTSSARLAERIAECEADEEIGAVVVTGAPPAFCAGADLTALGAAHETGLRSIYAGFLAVARCSLPTIAAVGGAAVGAGLNLALACDVRLAGPLARFDARFLQLGLHPGGGMTWMLQRIVGPQTAMAMTVLGQKADAATAERTGLTLRTVDGDHDALVAAAVELAGPAAAAPRELVLSTKHTLRTTATLTEHAEAVEIELVAQLESMTRPAFTELLAAMREKISRSR
ncbi:MAG TPA: enoyl-CoA hydratase [Actinophytocola sp.]|uniref:enoyl-CoA hydratase n=1 Tax=Actinophytocola sp. TaxID=1872138 RepID=UPI002DB5B7E6|nr:enoyl-CoA hydratase [Actinophytocola sp.]HEU5476081.1 enoyl-CoA hydratase [Actinophytocola sp.]